MSTVLLIIDMQRARPIAESPTEVEDYRLDSHVLIHVLWVFQVLYHLISRAQWVCRI